jgi:hypothetical protein
MAKKKVSNPPPVWIDKNGPLRTLNRSSLAAVQLRQSEPAMIRRAQIMAEGGNPRLAAHQIASRHPFHPFLRNWERLFALFVLAVTIPTHIAFQAGKHVRLGHTLKR